MSCTSCDGNVEFEFSDTFGDALASCSECGQKFQLEMELDIKKFDEAD
jgi:transcription elongation factor Elf1